MSYINKVGLRAPKRSRPSEGLRQVIPDLVEYTLARYGSLAAGLRGIAYDQGGTWSAEQVLTANQIDAIRLVQGAPEPFPRP